jgi:hypothetical protein
VSPAIPSHRHHAKRGRQPERLCGAVELSQCEPGLGPDRPGLWINHDSLHAGQVEHDGAVAHRVSCDAVTAPAHRDRKTMSTCELDRADYVSGIQRPDYGQRVSINHAVEHAARGVIAAVLGPDHWPLQTRPELAANRCAKNHAHQSRVLAP